MVESEKVVDQRYIADGWLPLSKGWPDRAYVRVTDGRLEVRFVEIKSPSCSVSVEETFSSPLKFLVVAVCGLCSSLTLNDCS